MAMKRAMGAILGAAMAALALVAANLSASANGSQADAFIEAALEESAAPGIAYALIEGGQVHARGFGEQAAGSGEPVTADTLFPIGSVSKSFTALAVMQLAEAGTLDIDHPVARHLPAFADGPAREVTLRQLLNHTSGFSTVQGNSQHGNADASRLGLLDYAGQLALLTPAYMPGERWEYSNANYQILGAVIEQASGQSYADFIQTRIFDPLGMASSVVVIGPNPPGVATGHRPWFGGTRAAAGGEGIPINAPAGGIVSSAQDLGRYLAFWLNGEDDIVSASTKAEMMAPSGPASPAYGLGWSLDPETGAVYHTGLVPGAETLASLRPAQGKGVVVMVNANGGLGFADTWYLIGGAGARALGEPHTDDGSRWGPRIAYLSIALLPPLFVILAFVSGRGASALRAKRDSKAGVASLWVPMIAMAGLAFFLLTMLPRVFGGSIRTLQLYQPDFAWCIIGAAILAPAWAALRLALAYSGNERTG